MSRTFPDHETVRTALSMAGRAPSVHNSQPWHWRVGESSLHLYAEPALQFAHTDPDGRDLTVSCGAALNHCTVALAALGWQSRIHRFPNPAEPHHLAAIEVSRFAPSDVDITLAAAIPRRRTDRRYFSHWPVAPGDIALMGARAARAGVTMRHVEVTTELRATLARAVWQHANDAEYLSELTTWSGRYGSTAGVPARNVPVSDARAHVPTRFFAGTRLAQPPEASAAQDNGLLLALGTAGDDAVDRLRAGEATSLVLLTATALGLATCPVTEPLEIAETREAVRGDVFADDGHPQMLIRVGWAPINADPLPATPRRPLSEIVAALGD